MQLGRDFGAALPGSKGAFADIPATFDQQQLAKVRRGSDVLRSQAILEREEFAPFRDGSTDRWQGDQTR